MNAATFAELAERLQVEHVRSLQSTARRHRAALDLGWARSPKGLGGSSEDHLDRAAAT